MFLAILSRYAMSEQPYLIDLAKEIADLLRDGRSLSEVNRICPTGGLGFGTSFAAAFLILCLVLVPIVMLR